MFKQGAQNNESAVEQAKDEQISGMYNSSRSMLLAVMFGGVCVVQMLTGYVS